MKRHIVVVAAAFLSLASVSPAAASPLRQPRSAPPQITGIRLATALLPAAAFGDTYTFALSENTGRQLRPAHPATPVPRVNCARFEFHSTSAGFGVSGFGNTAGAAVEHDNTDFTIPNKFSVYQRVLQFASVGAATAFFAQSYTKYAVCAPYSVPDPTLDHFFSGNTVSVELDSRAMTSVGGNRAFAVAEKLTTFLPGGYQIVAYLTALYATARTNVYELWELGRTDDLPAVTLLSTLIRHVQALYPRQ